MSQSSELDDLEVDVYRAVLRKPGSTLRDISDTLLDPLQPLDKALSCLVEIGLLREQSGQYTAINPRLAEAISLGPDELELAARRSAVEARRAQIRQVLPDWMEFLRDEDGVDEIEIVLDPADINRVTMYHANRCQSELLSVAPRGPSKIDARTRMANVYNAERGIKTRALYPHSALRDRASRAYLKELSELGTRVRLVTALPGRCMVVDRQVAILPIPYADDPSHWGLAIVRELNVVAWVVSTFEQMWAEATPLDELLGAEYASTEIDQTRAAILRLLADGEKDEAISRRLSISVRTCRRHIAEYMIQIGATSRFQAGVIAARARHLDRNDSPPG